LSAIVKRVNLFHRILNSLCIFQNTLSVFYRYTENTPKLLNRVRNLHQNSLSAHGDYGKLGFFYLYKLVSEYARSIQTYSENIWKVFKRINGEYAELRQEA